tara:strand:+ start:120 stop:347 length:228 start_codon:yes stop_codon:yes gene_type:complete
MNMFSKNKQLKLIKEAIEYIGRLSKPYPYLLTQTAGTLYRYYYEIVSEDKSLYKSQENHLIYILYKLEKSKNDEK